MRFLVRLGAAFALGAAALLSWVLAGTSAGQLAATLAGLATGPSRPLAPLAFTPPRLLALRLGLVGVAALAALVLGLTHRRRPRPGRWRLALRQIWRGLTQPWWQLPLAARYWLVGMLGVVALARLYYTGWYPLNLDELASYDYSVLPGAAATASVYAYPNNHILANLLAGGVRAALPAAAPVLALRLLPTLAGLLALPVVALGLLRYLRPAAVLLGLGLFSLSPLPVFYAVAGRGYAWAMLATWGGLLAALALANPVPRPGPQRRLAWGLFCGSSWLGLYAVPTHLYVVVALGAYLLGAFASQVDRGRPRRLLHLVAASGVVVVGTALLYAPVGAVSGWPALLANPYVARASGAVYWAAIGSFLTGTATELLGRAGWSALVWGGLAVGIPWLLARATRLPRPSRQLGWALYAQLVLWLPLALGQHVYPPARTLLPVLLAFFLLLALLAQAARAYWPRGAGGGRGQGLLVVAAVLAGYGSYRLYREQRVLVLHQAEERALHRAYGWLRTQPLRRIWVVSGGWGLVWRHYALAAGQPLLPLAEVDETSPSLRPGPAGEVTALAHPPSGSTPVLYQAEQRVFIVPLAPAARLAGGVW